jgi:cytochrome c oxidase accessory protein FixG
VYWWFREQVCIVVCPYGRLQGVLLDKNSILVAYDYNRGEPRGKFTKTDKHDSSESIVTNDAAIQLTSIAPVKGDCIDCHACVRVCPTGIDIRNGTQLECVNCTACIDACDDIMVSVNKPKGLVRYASENSIKNGVQLKFTARIKAYSVVLTLLLTLLTFLIVSRTDLDARVMRISGMTYTSLPDGRIANLYTLKLANKTHLDIPFTLILEDIKGEIQIVGNSSLVVKKKDYSQLQFFIQLKRADVTGWKKTIHVGLYENGVKLKTMEANFIGPEVYE